MCLDAGVQFLGHFVQPDGEAGEFGRSILAKASGQITGGEPASRLGRAGGLVSDRPKEDHEHDERAPDRGEGRGDEELRGTGLTDRGGDHDGDQQRDGLHPEEGGGAVPEKTSSRLDLQSLMVVENRYPTPRTVSMQVPMDPSFRRRAVT